MLQILLHRCDEIDALPASQVVPAAVNQQDIRGCSSSEGPSSSETQQFLYSQNFCHSLTFTMKHYEGFLKVFERRPGQQDRKLKEMMSTVVEDDIDAACELAIRGLCIYLNEDPKDLIQEYVDMEEDFLQCAIEKTTMGIFVIKHTADNEAHDVGIVLEGVAVLQDLDSVDLATSMLFGLIYALNLQYPTKLHFTTEILQKLIMELDAGELYQGPTFQI
ncbi:uncharacterized protein LOC132152552 [Carassius carassius]|uniref:uncharacterized protein LOC132152552 n=1 Tax=Carassius carassius TaxID=217509 RepID=UPI0028695268|nr:uncharacterized protein LOC132152552 [Carassius carassius]